MSLNLVFFFVVLVIMIENDYIMFHLHLNIIGNYIKKDNLEREKTEGKKGETSFERRTI